MALVYDKALYDAQYSVRAWEHGVRDTPRIPRFRYNWFTQTQGQFARLKNIANAIVGGPGWASFTNVAMIGGGFGWTAELLLEAKPTLNIVNVETSPHVIGTIATSEEADLRQYLIDDGFDPDNIDFLVDPADPSRTLTNAEAWAYWLRPDGVRSSIQTLDNDLANNGRRRDVRNALPGNMDAIITEIALDAQQTEAEIDDFLDRVDRLRPNPACTVVHVVEFTPQDLGYISKTVPDWAVYLNARGYSDHWLLSPTGELQRADGVTL
jgi:hypothetical protein